MRVTRFTVIHPGDILLIDFGTNTSKSRVDGRHLAYVIGREDISSRDEYVMVIPVFRQRTRRSNSDDIKIRKKDCPGLHYPQYANVSNIQKVDRCRVERLIGYVSNPYIRDSIVDLIRREAGEFNDE